MKKNEIKKTVEQVVRTEYIAEDGEVFTSEEECKKYEESALFTVSKQLTRLAKTSHSAIIDDFSDDCDLEIFDIRTEKDLENLRRYLYLTLSLNHGGNALESCFDSKDGKRSDFVFSNVTYGHEVLIFFAYDRDWFWVYRDGSVRGLCEYITDRVTKITTPKTEENV